MIESARPRWWIDFVLLVAFVALTLTLMFRHIPGVGDSVLNFDQTVADWAAAHQPGWLYWPARVLNYLGQGGQVLTPVALILTAALMWRTRSVRTLFPFIAAYILTYFTIGPLKLFTQRAAPRFKGADRLYMFNKHVHGQGAMSYPSGHLGNSMVWYAVFAILTAALLRRRLTGWETFWIRAVPPVILFTTMVYTDFHWLSDTVGGILLGWVLARIMERIAWDRIPLPRMRGWEGPAGLPEPPARHAPREVAEPPAPKSHSENQPESRPESRSEIRTEIRSDTRPEPSRTESESTARRRTA